MSSHLYASLTVVSFSGSFFRVIPALVFLNEFASDRSHMVLLAPTPLYRLRLNDTLTACIQLHYPGWRGFCTNAWISNACTAIPADLRSHRPIQECAAQSHDPLCRRDGRGFRRSSRPRNWSIQRACADSLLTCYACHGPWTTRNHTRMICTESLRISSRVQSYESPCERKS